MTASSAVVFIILELFIIKLSCYFIGVSNQIHIMDFLALIGYNFVGINCTIIAGCLFGKLAKHAVFIYSSLAMSFFIVTILFLSIVEVSKKFCSPF